MPPPGLRSESWRKNGLSQVVNTLEMERGGTEDIKTVQSLLRHANPGITMAIYTHAVSSRKRKAQSRVVKMVLPASRKRQLRWQREVLLNVCLLVYHAVSALDAKLLKRMAGTTGLEPAASAVTAKSSTVTN